MYKLTLYTTGKNLLNEFIVQNSNGPYVFESYDRETCLENIKELIFQSVELDQLQGEILVNYNITENDEYIDSEEFMINIEKVYLTNEPSKYINWEHTKLPYIYTVDREKTKIIIEL